MRIDFRTLLYGWLLVASSLTVANDDVEFFEKKIRPALITYCYECHSTDSKAPGGELLLDTRAGVLSGGDSGPALHVGQPDNSLLIKAIRYTDDSVKMPPKGKLPEAVIADLEEWVKRGAPDPRTESSKKKSALPWHEVMRERSDWWSLKPIATVGIPSTLVGSSSEQPVDRFVRSKQTERGLTPAEPTDPTTLARRLSLVLTGLPPTADQVEAFTTDCQAEQSRDRLPSAAVERYVDSLLQSPHFGEQWARHWMDVVRFCETHGNEWNYEVHHAWRYRDYLIRAFNQDVPYDQFVREHIAGDLLPHPRMNAAEQFNESVIGTGFYRFGEVNHDDCISLRSIGYDLADNQIDTLTKAFQATTVACARCHNHKLDAISAEDYYAMLAVMRSSRNVSHCIDAPQVNAEPKRRLRELKSELRQELVGLWRRDATQLTQYLHAARAVRTNSADADVLKAGLDPARLEKWIATLANDKLTVDDPFDLWRRLCESETPGVATAPADALAVSSSYPQVWEAAFQQFTQEESERAESNRSRFTNYADFRESGLSGWLNGGMASLDAPTANGEFVVQPAGDELVQAILPAGRFTHVLSAKLNGTLRSQVLAKGKKYISFEVLGQRSSAVRLVSNNCQLNYANYRALTSAGLQWITFTIPDDREILQTYAELMTMFDNPKFPDQLSPLGGDRENYKLPWDKAAENPRSYFGVTRVVLHDEPGAPRAELSHLRSIYLSDSTNVATTDQTVPSVKVCPTPTEVENRYVARITSAIEAWAADRANEGDVRWLDAMVRYQLLSNRVEQSPRCAALVQEYRDVDAQLSLPRVVVGLGDGGPGIEQPVFLRGDYARAGDMVPRRYLEVMAMVRPEGSAIGSTVDIARRSKLDVFTSHGSGRLELAEQIIRPDNPLTARVMVNRIWHHLFGTGLVRTVDDFGHVGEQPSHPELLDHIARQFVADGWSVKKMIRMLVLTRTFQLSNRPSEASREIDPQNRLLQHYPARRMEAESVRDSILAASGRLDRTLYGPSIQPYREKEYADRRLFPGPLDGNGRRSIYIKNNLMEAPKFLAAFNFPGGKVTQGRRDVTNVPAQALALLNDPFVLQQADVWSQRVLSHSRDSVPTRLTSMFQSAVNRSPTAEEQARFGQSIQELATLYQIPRENLMTSSVLWKDVAHALINMSELIYIP
ncbi:PSD1 and planctomycete cytochrome C domain-containing protein [Schlesneria paludicola]|uniref:PSD1 and planctomycete cytochrome C domain-containing protein n=1 Tax=Schlesneria paludicola TaxID=360056 RepID=UPI000299EAE6|nr:PSD1 and planctomycete cytochrome C domain-containing protein [Schlesneria paludicola]